MFVSIAEALFIIALAFWTIYSFVKVAGGPAGQRAFDNYIINFLTSLLTNAAKLLANLEGSLRPLVAAFVAAFQSGGPSLANEIRGPVETFTRGIFNESTSVLEALGQSDPGTAISFAATAMAQAFGSGFASFGVTAAFESVFPEKLNVLNGMGPMLAELAGFAEVAGAVREPLYENAFGTSLKYYYRGKFKPDYPDETDAVLWHARGLLDDAQLDEIFQVSGLKQKYEPAFLTSAYHSISPFVMIRLLEAGVFDEATARDELTFAGIRPKSQDRMIAGAAYLVADPYRKQVVASLEAEYANGLIDDADFQSLEAATRHTNDIDALTLQRAQLQRHIKLSGELEAAYLALGLSGLIDEPTYTSLLAGLPMTQDAINAKLAVLDARLKATTQKQLLAQERALERQTLAVERRTAMRNYASGIIDEAALAVALIATGLTAVQVAAWVDLAVLQKKGTIRFVYGLEKTPADAQLLRERVASLLDQRKKMLIDDAGFVAQLQALGIPADVQNALLAGAAALTTPASARELVTVRTG